MNDANSRWIRTVLNADRERYCLVDFSNFSEMETRVAV